MTKQDLMKRDTLVQDIPCEEIVLADIMTNNSVLYDFGSRLTPSCFYKTEHEEIFKAILSICERGEVAELCSVSQELLKMGSKVTYPELALIAKNFTRTDISKNIAYLVELRQKRDLAFLGMKLTQECMSYDSDVDDAKESILSALNGMCDSGSQDTITLRQGFERLYERIDYNFAHGGNKTGTLTGFDFLDKKGGLQPSDLIVIAGDTSMGKTSFTNAIILNAISTEKKVVFCSLEMNSEQLSARYAAMLSNISSFRLLNSQLREDELVKIDKHIVVNEFENNLFINEKVGSNIEAIISYIRSMKRKHDIDGAVLDYLQILSESSKAANEEKHMADCARRLKNLAKELNIWIIAISQLSRNANGENPEPTINRLRSSGQIAEAADMVMLVYRPEAYKKPFPKPFDQYDTKGKSMINLCKGRNVGTGTFICGFNAETTHFYQLDEMELEKKSESIPMPWD